MDTDLFLENDGDAKTLDFVAARNQASEQTLKTPEFEADRDKIQAMIEREDRLIIPTRRGKWLFDFKRSKDNPLGLWLRLPADQVPTTDAAWEPVLDFDAFCEKEGKRWIYSGAITSPMSRRGFCSSFPMAVPIFCGSWNSTPKRRRLSKAVSIRRPCAPMPAAVAG